jgi:hypothetical protein
MAECAPALALLQVSGMRFAFDPSLPSGQRVVLGSVTVGDAPLQPGGVIRMHLLGACARWLHCKPHSCPDAPACTAAYCTWHPACFPVLQMGSTAWLPSSTLQKGGTVRLAGLCCPCRRLRGCCRCHMHHMSSRHYMCRLSTHPLHNAPLAVAAAGYEALAGSTLLHDCDCTPLLPTVVANHFLLLRTADQYVSSLPSCMHVPQLLLEPAAGAAASSPLVVLPCPPPQTPTLAGREHGAGARLAAGREAAAQPEPVIRQQVAAAAAGA